MSAVLSWLSSTLSVRRQRKAFNRSTNQQPALRDVTTPYRTTNSRVHLLVCFVVCLPTCLFVCLCVCLLVCSFVPLCGCSFLSLLLVSCAGWLPACLWRRVLCVCAIFLDRQTTFHVLGRLVFGSDRIESDRSFVRSFVVVRRRRSSWSWCSIIRSFS